jgi:hypothetical protein
MLFKIAMKNCGSTEKQLKQKKQNPGSLLAPTT